LARADLPAQAQKEVRRFRPDMSIWRSLGLRFGVPLVALLAGATYLAVPHVDRILTEWFRTDVESRSRLVAASIEDGMAPLLEERSERKIHAYLEKVTTDERLLAVLVCLKNGKVAYKTERAPTEVECTPPPTDGAPDSPRFEVITGKQGLMHVGRFPLTKPLGPFWGTTIVHDLSFIDRRQSRLRDYFVAFSMLATLFTVALSVGIAWFLLRNWAGTLVRDIRNRGFMSVTPPGGDSKQEVLNEVREVLRELERAQRMEVDFKENWTAEALHHIAEQHLENAQIIIVSNREPYIHNRTETGYAVQYPASGMVTALEPVVRACGGVWIAHGSGSADRDVVDAHDRLKVPPDDPSYVLRRVWMSDAEEQGYYYGFSNEGLWPLCHLAFVRPAFRPGDFEQYQAINERFAAAVEAEATTESPVVLIQDYHFALLPGLIRKRLPKATIAVFWHIPWPNAEAFGICPWKRELMEGMLAADIVGLHTRYHCQNFLATVDRNIESHIDYEAFSVSVRDHICMVRPYPISIEWPPRWLDAVPLAPDCRRNVFERYGLSAETKLGVGIERWDFTKGIIERIEAIETLLERTPELRGRLVFVQVAAPTRGELPAYRALRESTLREVDRVNTKFGHDRYQPIILISEHRGPEQVFELYRACDFCVVNSLHDGMNLVAKEFVSARDDEDGVLVLSSFAGASRELVEALIVNPYDTEATAAAIARALRMPKEERRQRMRLMRLTVKENNVYRWAGRMLMDVARIRRRQRLESLAPRERLAGLGVSSPWH
jgi:trehalose 6-phosphate synthase